MNSTTERCRLTALLLAGLLLALYPAVRALALGSDREQPMSVEADRANIDNRNEVSTYLGNVIVTQGSLRITADKLTVYSRERTLEKMYATGKPATYRQRPDGKQQDVNGRGLRIEYFADSDTAIFIDDAMLEQENNTFKSDRILYDVAHDKVDAGKASGGDRVRILLQPRANGEQK